MPPARASASQSVSVRALRRVLVAGDDRDVRRHAAVRHRDPGVRGRGDRAGDAGHDLERHAGGEQRLGLLAAAAEHERVAALQPHDGHRRPRPRSTSSALISPASSRPGPAPCRRRSSSAPRRRELRAAPATRAGRRRRRRRARSSSAPRHGEQPGIAGPGADEVDGHATTSSAVERARGRRARRAAPSAAATPTAIGVASVDARAQHDVAVERCEQRVQRDRRRRRRVASAPHGRSQPPPSSARNARSAPHRAVRVGVVDRGEPLARVASSSARHSTASAPCATCGSITDGSSTSATALGAARAVRARRPRRRSRRSLRRRACAAGSRCCRAARRT